MTAMAIDTLKTAQRLQDSGFTRKQAAGVAEVLAETIGDALSEHPGRDAVISAVQESAVGINRRIEASERRLGERVDQLDGKVDALSGRVDQLDGKVDALSGRVDQLDGKVDALSGRVDQLDGKVEVLTSTMNENHLELNRKLDAIMGLLQRP